MAGNNNGNNKPTSTAVVATKKPRRLVTPAELNARAKLEFVHYPLYSSVMFNAGAPLLRENPVFGYAIGDPVAGTPGAGGGTIVAHNLHTNLETARFLSSPKIFVTRGLRVFYNLLDFDVGGAPVQQDTAAAAAAAITAWDDFQRIWYSGFFRFFVGPKDYARAPLVRVPGNTGIQGPAAITIDDDTTAAAQFAMALYAKGVPWRMDTYPVTIYSQQSFGASIDFLHTTNPSLAADRMLTVAMDGILGREVV